MSIRISPAGSRKLFGVGGAIDANDPNVGVAVGGEVTLIGKDEENDGAIGDGGQPRREAGTGGGGEPLAGTPVGRKRTEADPEEVVGLRVRYPTARILRQDNGIWVVVACRPLGCDGPIAHFAIAVPHNQELLPRAWAFWGVGWHVAPIGPRHTNFPHHDVCAYVPDDGTWSRGQPLSNLIDLYSEWAFRQLFLREHGSWVGRQIGATALYRRTEFQPDEWCGCDEPKRYKECHMAADASLSQEEAEADHRRVFQSPYVKRQVPAQVLKFARSSFKSVPKIDVMYRDLGLF